MRRRTPCGTTWVFAREFWAMIATTHASVHTVHAGVHSSVLALNRQYAPVHIISARRAFCLLYKGLAEVIAHEETGFQSYDFDGWLDSCLVRLSLQMIDDDADWIRT